MKITNINRYRNNINFKAKEYALLKTVYSGVEQNFKVLKLSDKDTKFLDVMSSEILLDKLTSEQRYKKSVLSMWKNVINNAIMMTEFSEPQESYLLISGNKPCGIMSYKNIQESYLDCVASWPIAVNNFVKGVGSGMFRLLFHNAEKSGIRHIFLDYVKESPIDLKKYYSSLGFVPNLSKTIMDSDMYITREQMSVMSQKLDKFITLKEIENPKTVNLKQELDINFLSQ